MSTATLREMIAATATRLGPDARTLCTPWLVRDLVAHLVLRESRPDAMPGVGLPWGPLQRHTEAVQHKIAGGDFAQLVERVRTGPPAYWPTRLPFLDRRINATELTVHLEDMVRAQPGWEPTVLPGRLQDGLWGTVRLLGRHLYRDAPVGVVAVRQTMVATSVTAPTGLPTARAALRRPRSGSGTVVLRGDPLELLLHAVGRERVARVSIEGHDQDVAALARHRRGL